MGEAHPSADGPLLPLWALLVLRGLRASSLCFLVFKGRLCLTFLIMGWATSMEELLSNSERQEIIDNHLQPGNKHPHFSGALLRAPCVRPTPGTPLMIRSRHSQSFK